MATCLLGIGANLDEPARLVGRAIQLLSELEDVRVESRSGDHWTKPIGGPPGQNDYLNVAVRVETSLAPRQLLHELQAIETHLGRQRGERWAARTIDLDLLLYDDHVVCTAELEIPHPRLAFRRFVLEPAVEVAPEMMHPTIGWTVGRLWEHFCKAFNYVAITGVADVGKTKLADAVASRAAVTAICDGATPNWPRSDAIDDWTTRDELDLLHRRKQSLADVFSAGATRNSSRTDCQSVQPAARGGRIGNPSYGDDVKPASSGAGAFVSDFWLEQALAYGRDRFVGSVLDQFERQCEPELADIVPPKLLVLIEQPLDQPLPDVSTDVYPRKAAVQAELKRLALRLGRGPTLWLNANQPELAIAELTAAIQSLTSS